MLGRHDRSTAYDTVTGDDVEGTRLVMEHLFELGHRRIVHLTRSEEVTRPGSGNPHAVRLEQYLALMHDAGLDGDIRVVRTGLDEEAARLDTLALLDEERPTAIFVGNDELAFGTLRALSEHGLSAAEVSVVGYDDVDIASHPAISLTTVEPGRRGHGRAGHPPAARAHRGPHRAHALLGRADTQGARLDPARAERTDSLTPTPTTPAGTAKRPAHRCTPATPGHPTKGRGCPRISPPPRPPTQARRSSRCAPSTPKVCSAYRAPTSA